MAAGRADTLEAAELQERELARIRAGQLDLAGLVHATETLKQAGRPELTIELYKSWIALNPDHPLLYAAMFNYGMALSDQKDVTGAVNVLRETARLKPDFYAAQINLGSALERLGQVGAAVSAWNGVATALPALNGENLNFKTIALKQIGRVLETSNSDALAEDTLRQSLELNPHQPDVVQHWIALRQRQCKWPLMADVGTMKHADLVAGISPLSAACYTDDPVFLLANSHRYCRTSIGLTVDPAEALPPLDPRNRRPGPLRIGYVSSDFREHAVGFSMTEVVEQHDRTVCEVFGYYCGVPASDATHQRTKAGVDHWHDLTGVSDIEAARLIRSHEIDILVDLNGYTKDARTRVFALRPAPVSVNWFGFPGTMASPFHHYLIADDTILPRELEYTVSESVLRLPCYQPNDRRRTVAAERPSRTDLGLPEDGFVFCSLNGMQKITERVFARWMEILSQVPGSVLWLLTGTDETNDRLRQAASARGVAPERLVFADKRANPHHLARYPLADLFLDTFPYGSHTTAADALWMGVPVLTLLGRSFAARVCASLVRAAGIGEMVCHTGEDYVARAVAYGRDPSTLRPTRERLLAGRDSCLLFDTPLLVRRLEGLYGEMAQAAAGDVLPVPRLRGLDLVHEFGTGLDLPDSEILSDEAYRAQYDRHLRATAATYGGDALAGLR
ncbi:tetratricopeptide repeat protein [Methylorubrum salsuginis]|uniref:Predicted O-linked N-acetylglucosamine transferase, SPINDLY family n=1 Tax=Methylorubrum salsuginis TaxID=414703 RepID=A0A1I4CSW2_9HYPH|nr:tetratricopeptide repeat protein [Methylorubrum salsuginis]SFK84384.1 Predicted O-linked N-acetylglucosamine transferase, SPINDLY family [Methylorubrum salsuginis]